MAIQLADEIGTPISGANPLPVEVVGVITLPAAVEVANDVGNPIPVSGTVSANTGLSQPLTDDQLRAAPVPVSGTVTANTGLTPLTDAQLRAAAVPVSGPLTDSQLRASAVPVTGGLTDTQLRASAVPVSAAALPLPTGAATEVTLAAQNVLVGAVTEAAPASDTASSGLNGRLQRIAQRITSLIALFPASIGQKTKAGSLAVTLASDSDSLPVNPIAGQTGVAAGAGAVGATTQRVTIARGTVTTLLNAVAATGAGSSAQPGSSLATFQAYGTTSSGAGSASIDVEVSNDDTRWVKAGTISLTLSTTAATDGFAIDAPWKYVRGNVTAISGTGAAATLNMGV